MGHQVKFDRAICVHLVEKVLSEQMLGSSENAKQESKGSVRRVNH